MLKNYITTTARVGSGWRPKLLVTANIHEGEQVIVSPGDAESSCELLDVVAVWNERAGPGEPPGKGRLREFKPSLNMEQPVANAAQTWMTSRSISAQSCCPQPTIVSKSDAVQSRCRNLKHEVSHRWILGFKVMGFPSSSRMPRRIRAVLCAGIGCTLLRIRCDHLNLMEEIFHDSPMSTPEFRWGCPTLSFPNEAKPSPGLFGLLELNT